ncbi:O-antigen translocase [Citrobacter portucalensis]|uniref:O-antigen translocase n=1 Tax=Citrobacter portucalensis TaxID=1639133 RepID=UPI00226B276C|nr:O-antigen translocase [Citrobacter portucalensis]MCX8986129.1 O-antigen translocase [Citrobacter portucalensis]
MRRVLKVTAMSGGLTFLKMLIGFVIAKIVAVYTGPSGLAILGQMQSLISALNGIVSSPVGSGVVRFTAENYSNGYRACSPWWRAALIWGVLLNILLVPLGIVFSRLLSSWVFHNDNYYWVICISLLLLPISAIGVLINSVINGHQQYKRYIALGLISTIASSVLMLVLISFYRIEGAIVAAAIQYSLIGLVLIIASIGQPWFKWKYWVGKTDKANFIKVGEYMIMAITTAVMTPLSLIVLRNILVENVGWGGVGAWQAVWKISEVYLSVITIALTTYYLPQLSKLNSYDDIIREIQRTSLAIMPIVLISALLVYFTRDYLLVLLFTKEFDSARDLFFWQLIGDVIKILSWMLAFPMISRGATKWYLFSEIFFGLLLIMLARALIPIYGVQGANYSYIINYTIYFIFVLFNIKRFIK